MKIQIVGCNNSDCKWFHENCCTLMPGRYDMTTGRIVEVQRLFDYDHKEGKIYCLNSLED